MSDERTNNLTVLFVCTANKLRSPTAEDVFKDYPGIEAMSAGTDASAPRPLTHQLAANADWIVEVAKTNVPHFFP
ncbi:MAG: hypothetical protein QNJ13_12505 [Paracoccaceae bacterium]|nr:hypothetical protein [Paracoccaceae bacterium]